MLRLHSVTDIPLAGEAAHVLHYASPIGALRLCGDGAALSRLEFLRNEAVEPTPQAPQYLKEAALQLSEYFAGTRKKFDLTLAPEGTAFQKRVWEELRNIAYGKTISYGKLAAALSNPKAVRAVGQANNRNPIPIIVPCHRVVGHSGKLVGYAGGLERKSWLLEHEQTGWG